MVGSVTLEFCSISWRTSWTRAYYISKAVTATVTKGLLGPRIVVIQAFQNAIVTYDAKNPQPWRVERANVGRDYAATFLQALR